MPALESALFVSLCGYSKRRTYRCDWYRPDLEACRWSITGVGESGIVFWLINKGSSRFTDHSRWSSFRLCRIESSLLLGSQYGKYSWGCLLTGSLKFWAQSVPGIGWTLITQDLARSIEWIKRFSQTCLYGFAHRLSPRTSVCGMGDQ